MMSQEEREKMYIPFVLEQIEAGLKKGYYEFKNSDMTLDKYLKIPPKDRMDIAVRLSRKGIAEAPDKDMIKNLAKVDIGTRYIKDTRNTADGFEIELTEEGVAASKLAASMGLDFGEMLTDMIEDGSRREINKYVDVSKGKALLGQTRHGRVKR